LARIRIIRKFANAINGIDLSRVNAGDVVDVPEWNAHMLVAEGWAEPVEAQSAHQPVLIVEDDDDTRRLLAEWLEQEGYPVVEARDGLEGLTALVGHRPGLVLLDLRMPGMDGIQFRRAQRCLPDHLLAHVPVVVVSGVDDADAQAAAIGATGVLRKPIDRETLVSAIASRIAH
jgi:CheY-like chemotaxis protein